MYTSYRFFEKVEVEMQELMRIVTLGGGTGHYALLRALKILPRVSLTAVVSVADSGGSSGGLRDQHGILPPGDILKAILALSEMDPDRVRSLLLSRFDYGDFIGHTIGNMLITMHATHTGDYGAAIRHLSDLLCVQHVVLPVTFASIHIQAEYANGEVRKGEATIDNYRGDEMVSDITIEPAHAYVCEPAKRALEEADVIVIAPGSVHTSLLPVLKVRGVSDLLAQSDAPKIFVCNTMTQNGDTRGFCAHDFTQVLEKAMGCGLDRVIVDVSLSDENALRGYALKQQYRVACRASCGALSKKFFGASLSSTGELVRHDYKLLATALRTVIANLFEQRTVQGKMRPLRDLSHGLDFDGLVGKEFS